MHIRQFVVAYGVEQDRLRAMLPAGSGRGHPLHSGAGGLYRGAGAVKPGAQPAFLQIFHKREKILRKKFMGDPAACNHHVIDIPGRLRYNTDRNSSSQRTVFTL